jgi:hypothetical protein
MIDLVADGVNEIILARPRQLQCPINLEVLVHQTYHNAGSAAPQGFDQSKGCLQVLGDGRQGILKNRLLGCERI